jgi:quercetin dioxygenase-like cupin family protein
MANVPCRTVIRKGNDLAAQATKRPGISERIFLSREECPHQNVAVIEIAEGAGVEVHPSPTSESFYVLEGVVEMLFPDGVQILETGDFCHLPTGVEHGLSSRGPAKVLVVFAPPTKPKHR